MSKEEYQSGKFVVTVLLSDGSEKEHQYDLPVTLKQAKEMLSMVFTALGKRNSGLLWFDNPITIYNPDNVSGIQFKFATSKQIEEFMKQVRKKSIGFLK
jgi:ACT domain-containing protein